MRRYDVVIIGGGVVGSAIARELSRYWLSVAVLERESDVCTQTSGRNTGMLHCPGGKRCPQRRGVFFELRFHR